MILFWACFPQTATIFLLCKYMNLEIFTLVSKLIRNGWGGKRNTGEMLTNEKEKGHFGLQWEPRLKVLSVPWPTTWWYNIVGKYGLSFQRLPSSQIYVLPHSPLTLLTQTSSTPCSVRREELHATAQHQHAGSQLPRSKNQTLKDASDVFVTIKKMQKYQSIHNFGASSRLCRCL